MTKSKSIYDRAIVWLSVAVVAFVVLLAASCYREPEPEVYGSWGTISDGFKWEYRIQRGGFFCRKLPELFQETIFCYEFTNDGERLEIDTPGHESWEYSFEGEGDVLVVKEYISGDTISKKTLILKRL